MASRRQFLQQSSLLSAAWFFNRDELFKKQKKVGLQLYTLRNEMGKDPKGSLQKVAALGYKEVETFGYNKGKWFGMDAKEFKSVLKTNGLQSPSGHTFPGGFLLKGNWEEDWKKAVEDAKVLGQEFIVIPFLEPNNRSPIDNYNKLAVELDKAGAISKSAGLQLAYHNHDFEFTDQEGKKGFDILLNETDPTLVKLELDLYWAVKAGQDPLKLFADHPGRFALWHVKDMDNTPKKFFTEVGNGVIDFKSIFTRASQSGMKHFFVEQDMCPGSPFDSIAQSISYIKKNIVN